MRRGRAATARPPSSALQRCVRCAERERGHELSIYFLGLIAPGRRRLSVRPVARRRGRSQAAALHSRPDLSRRLRRHLRCWCRCSLIFVDRRPGRRPDRGIRRRSPPSIRRSLDDELRRGAALRDIEAVAAGQYSGEPHARRSRRAAETYASVRAWANNLILAAGLVFGLLGLAFGLRTAVGARSAPATRSSASSRSSCSPAACVAVLTTIGIVVLGAVRDRAVLRARFRRSTSCSALQWSRRPRSAPIRSARPAPSASCRWSPARC